VLLLDKREHYVERMLSKLCRMGILVEQRTLPIGDFLWIARGTRSSAGDDGAVEVCLGTVVERKTAQDLASSLYGTRFNEQRLRLRRSSQIDQIVFLVEAAGLDLPNCPGKTLHYAMVETLVQQGFAVRRTVDLDDTIRWLASMHKGISRRAYPDDQPDRQSFCKPPTVTFGRERHVTYEELQKRVEWDREFQTKSVRAIFGAMLLQVGSISVKKAKALTDRFPTPRALLEEICYGTGEKASDGGADALGELELLGSSSVRRVRVGKKASENLRQVLGVAENGVEQKTPSST